MKKIIILSICFSLLASMSVHAQRGIVKGVGRAFRTPIVRIEPMRVRVKSPVVGAFVLSSLSRDTMRHVRINPITPQILTHRTAINVEPIKEVVHLNDVLMPAPTLTDKLRIRFPKSSNLRFAQQTSAEQVQEMTERFVSYARIGSQAKDTSTFFLTEGQKEMAIRVYNDIKAIPGVEFVILDTNYYYVYAKVAGNKKGVPSICWAAHLDIAFEVDGPANGLPICPRVHRNYNGGVITLENGVVLSPDAPEGRYLRDHVGETIISSSGLSLLGADDKCGISIILTLIERLVEDDSPRGDNYFIFSQNEEVGLSAEKLDLTYLDAVPDMLIDVDGSDPGEVSRECFTGVNRTYRFYGNKAHTSDGSHFADARTAMCYFIGCLPPEIHPSYSEGRKGYVHCYSMKEVDGHDWVLSFRIRYFDRSDSLVFDSILTDAVRRTREAYDRVRVSLDTSFTQYDNFAYSMHKGTIKAIVSAAQRLGMPMRPTSLRAGTTSALMVAKGLPGGPCIFSGAHNEHSCLEWVSIEELCEITRLCNEIVHEVAKMEK